MPSRSTGAALACQLAAAVDSAAALLPAESARSIPPDRLAVTKLLEEPPAAARPLDPHM